MKISHFLFPSISSENYSLQKRMVCQMMSLLFRYENIPVIIYLVIQTLHFPYLKFSSKCKCLTKVITKNLNSRKQMLFQFKRILYLFHHHDAHFHKINDRCNTYKCFQCISHITEALKHLSIYFC